jgi:hypothetical protein
MNKLYVVYMVIPVDDNASLDSVPEFDFTGCISNENDGVTYMWSFLNMQDAVEARKAAWEYCKHKQFLGFVDMGIRYANGEEDVEGTTTMQEDLENKLSELLGDLAMEKTTGCIDIALTALLKAAIIDLESPPEIFHATVERIFESISDTEDDGNEEPPKVFH